MAEEFKSTDNRRVTNNIMRHNYRTLSDTEKKQMDELKDAGLAFVQLLHRVGGTDPAPNDARQSSRYLSLSQTAIEEAVMWAVKHVTG